MQQIINFIIRNKSFLLFLLLFFVSILLTIQSHDYHKSKFINSANFISGTIYNTTNGVSQYFDLKQQNELLNKENSALKSILINTSGSIDTSYLDSTTFQQRYKFTPAKVIKNSYSSSHNILLLNKGARDSIKEDLGVITAKGILGVIDNYSNKYATVISILNTNSKISAQLKRTNHYGSLIWDGKTPEFIQLLDVEVKANVKVGDTIMTSGISAIFPKGILIGTIDSFKKDAAENFFEINVKLFNDMTNIEHVTVIENMDKSEINALLDAANE
jgi:rod shape-determining protein MreC